MAQTPQGLEGVLAASIDGRAYNVFHRQTQLERLHNAIQRLSSDIKEAIISDGLSTSSEAAIEHFACMKCIKGAYYSLSPKAELENEYQISKGRNSSDNRVPVGIVSIEPTNHTFFYSVLAPVSSAIAAGNCVVLRLEQNLRKSHSVLRRILIDVLEQDTIAIIDAASGVKLPESLAIRVVQQIDEPWPRSNLLASSTSSPVVAVVDRTADLQLAARELVAARVCFGGSSPYAPDVVYVNEFVKQDFLQQVLQQCVLYSRELHGVVHDKPKQSSLPSVVTALESLRKQDDGIRVVMQEEDLAVVDFPSRLSQPISRQLRPILVMHSVRSADDAIELTTGAGSTRYAATYHFGDAATGQYLAHSIPSEISFINHIHRELLLGPRYPTGHIIDLESRYPPHVFTNVAPEFINPTTESIRLSSILTTKGREALQQIIAEAAEPLLVVKRPAGKGIGFFEQGLLFNVSLILLTTVSTSAVGIYYAFRLLR